MHAFAEPTLSIAKMESGDIDPAGFDHESHVYVAWLYVSEFPLPEAIGRFSTALRRLTTKLGVPGKYHATITWFFLLLIAERRADAADESWLAFRNKNDDLFSSDPDILERYYSRELLGSERARRSFVFPDR